MSASHDAVALRDLAVSLGVAGADLARRMRAGGVRVADTKSSAVDVVTAADRAVEEHLRDRLAHERPDDAILGEEGDDVPGTSGLQWVLDPIDGTVNYLYGLPECAVSVAARVGAEVVAGAVVRIADGVVYAAARGHGATRDGEPLRVRAVAPAGEQLVLTGFGYREDVRTHQASCVAAMLPRVRDIRRMGSCALDLCHVAEGAADAYVEEGPQPWDWSAGGLVLSEAGGRFEVLPGSLHRAVPDAPVDTLVVGTSSAGWDGFLDLLDASGFMA